MYEIGQEIDFKKIKREKELENYVKGFILGFSLVVIILMEI